MVFDIVDLVRKLSKVPGLKFDSSNHKYLKLNFKLFRGAFYLLFRLQEPTLHILIICNDLRQRKTKKLKTIFPAADSGRISIQLF